MDEMIPIFRLIATFFLFFVTLRCVVVFYALLRDKAIKGDDAPVFFIHTSILFVGTIAWVWQK